MAVRVYYRHCRTETCQRVEEAVANTAVAERSVLVRMRELKTCLKLEPRCELRCKVGRNVHALEIDVGITQQAVLLVVASRYVILGSLAATGYAKVVALLEGSVLIVKLKVVDIANTLLLVLEGRVHIGISWQLLPRIYA